MTTISASVNRTIDQSAQTAAQSLSDTPVCRALSQCVDARLRRLEAICPPEVLRLVVECEEHRRAYSLELARQCYIQGLLDAKPLTVIRGASPASL